MQATFLTTGFFLVGTVGLVAILVLFVNGRRYLEPSKALSPVEFAVALEEAEREVTDLAPRMLLLEEKERGLGRMSGQGVLPAVPQARYRTLLREAPTAGAWRRYSAALAMLEDRPLEALYELREVSWMVETAIKKLCEAEKLARVGGRTW